jgi:protein TonB
MALRALVFSSDGSTTSALCHVLTDLGIEAEICSEMLVAVERVTSHAYDALLVDWDQQAEAIFLVKQLRELKLAAQALTLALVQNDEDLPKALQAGANSVIRKPIDSQQAHDTLATAKQLILGRQTEQRNKEARLAIETVVPPAAPAEGNFVIDDPANADLPAQEEKPKRGFLSQTAPRTAIEAEELLASVEPAPVTPAPAVTPSAPDPSVRERAMSILGYGPKAEASEVSADDSKHENQHPGSAERPAAQPGTAPLREPRSQDTNHEFSSLPENFDQLDDETPASAPHYGIYAFAASLLIAGVLWVFAPGDSYLARLKNLHTGHTAIAQTAAPTPKVEPRPAAAASASKVQEPVLPDPALTDAQDEASSNIQVIETKPIPVAGAQQPPTAEPQPDAQSVPAPDAPPVPSATPAQVPAETTAPPHSQLQAAAETQVSSAPPQPVVAPMPPVVRAPENVAPPDPAAGRTGVIIPDSLKNSPSASPAGSLEPPIIPEETSRALIIKKVDPDYPPFAIPQRLEGAVILQAYIGQDGTVRDLKLVRGYFLLGRAAFDAVKQWRFKPYSQNGKNIDFQTYITINFKLPS